MPIDPGLAAIGAGFAVLGAGVGIGIIGGSAIQAAARQPEQYNRIFGLMILMGALVEGVALFALVECLMALNK